MLYIQKQLLSGASVVNTSAGVHIGGKATVITVYVKFGPGTTAGAVTVEEAPTLGETATWSPVATVTWAAANRVHAVTWTGSPGAVRTRVSTAIAGGTVDTWIFASQR